MIEPGSGASLKTELLIEALDECAGYIPIDISDSMLSLASARTAERFPGLPIAPVHADFMTEMDLPKEARLGSTRVLYFPGSTIGNFGPEHQRQVLRSFRRMAGEDGSVLVGFDRVKSIQRMEAAYNDTAGVTADFNLNVIDRLEGEFGFDVSRDDFEFHSEWNADRQAIVSYVVAVRPVSLDLGDRELSLSPGDRIRTEESHKFTPERIERLAAESGLRVRDTWCDQAEDFAVVRLVRA